MRTTTCTMMRRDWYRDFEDDTYVTGVPRDVARAWLAEDPTTWRRSSRREAADAERLRIDGQLLIRAKDYATYVADAEEEAEMRWD